MKSMVKIIFLASLFLMMVATAAFATPYVVAGDSIQLASANTTGYNGYGAGVMDFNVWGTGVSKFQIGTFCIQDNVDIGWSSYTVGNVSDIVGWSKSDPNGNSSIKGEGQLTGAANWLYAQYANHKFGTLTASQQSDFQNLLWYLQGEDTAVGGTPESSIGTTFSTTSDWYNAYVTSYVGGNLGAENPSGYWGTEVLNIVDSCGTVQQNQLVYQPVPEPSALLLLCAGLACALLMRRRSAIKNI